MNCHKVVIFVLIFLGAFANANKELIIDLKNQKIYAVENRVIMMVSKISSGKKGYTKIGRAHV